MVHNKKIKINSSLAQIIIVILVSMLVVQATQIATAQDAASDGRWTLGFQILNAQNTAATVFSPFDQIQLFANVSYYNASQPDILVTFKIQGPSQSANPINITRIAATDSNGGANCSFNLPIETQSGDSLIGTWQATATIGTDNGAIQKNLSFTTQWTLEIASLSIKNAQSENQTIFYPNNHIALQLGIANKGPAQTANITLTMYDSTGKLINQTQILNSQIGATGADPTVVEADMQIPAGSITGESSVTAAIFSGNYGDRGISAGENKTAYFTIATNTAPTPTPTVPLPTPFENSVSLFSWVLIASGIFTFTALFMFLKRKPPSAKVQTPIFAPSTPAQEVRSPSVTQPLAPQVKLESLKASDKLVQAQTLKEMAPKFEALISSTPTDGLTSKPSTGSTLTQTSAETLALHLSEISSTAKRIEILNEELKNEKKQLSEDIKSLNKTIEDQERAVKQYYDAIRHELAKLEPAPADTEKKVTDETPKNQPQKEDIPEEKKKDDRKKQRPAQIHFVI